MAADDLALAVVALKDDATRSRVAEGDLAALGERDLSAEEQALVRRVAQEAFDPEVETFETSGLYQAYTYCYGKVSEPVMEAVRTAFGPAEGDEVEGFEMSVPRLSCVNLRSDIPPNQPVGDSTIYHCNYGGGFGGQPAHCRGYCW